jgi:hypothetical protein
MSSGPAPRRCASLPSAIVDARIGGGEEQPALLPHYFFLPLEFYELLLGGHLVGVQDQRLLSPEEVERWWTDLRAKAEQEEFLATLTAFIVAGSKL